MQEVLGAVPKQTSMARTTPPFADLERQILRSSVSALRSGRHLCVDCRRTPLVGEQIFVYDSGRTVCELCRQLRRDEPIASEPVRDSEPGQLVRVRRRAA